MDMKQKKQIAIISVIIIAVISGIIFSVKLLLGNTAKTDGPIYSTAKVTRGDIQVGVTAKGQLQATYGGGITVPVANVSSDAQVSFTIREVFVKEGDAVKQGQVLVALKSDDLDSKIETKRNELDSLLNELSEITGKPVSEVESINPAKGIVLTAPIDGRVTSLSVEDGSSLDVGANIASVVDDSKFKVKAKLLSEEAKLLKEGNKVKLSFPYFDGTIDGIVTSVNKNPIPDSSTSSSSIFGSYATGFVYIAYITANNPGLVQKGMDVSVGIPSSGNTVNYFKYFGTVEGFMNEEKIINRSESIVTDVYVYEYQTVKKGDPICQISGDDLQEKLSEKLRQIRELKNTISQLESQYQNLEIRSNMNGIISYIDAQPGRTVQQGEWLGDIYNTSQMLLWMQVDDIDVINVAVDAPVTVSVDALPGKTFKGKVKDVSSQRMGEEKSNASSKFDVTVEVAGGEGLRPGMQATAFVDAGKSKNALLVPVEALFEENGEQKVEVLVNGKPKTVIVKLGLISDKFAEVLSGLKEGDLVITGSNDDLLPSDHIKVDDSLVPSKQDSGSGNGGNDAGTEKQDDAETKDQ